MKKPIVTLVITVGVLLVAEVFTPARAQSPTPSGTPTFHRPVLKTYVNGWPRFTITYPKDWVERPLFPTPFRTP
jgi:hypothetical protein